MIERQPFGTTPDGTAASRFVLTAGSARAAVTDYGATLLSVEVPDRDGRAGDVLLGYGSLEGYLGPNPACYGGTIGPVANRTDRAEVPLAGAVYHLPGNDGPNAANNLHTDLDQGLHRRVWSAQADDAANAVRMTCRMADGELGLPGNRTFSRPSRLPRRTARRAHHLVCVRVRRDHLRQHDEPRLLQPGRARLGLGPGGARALDADAFLPVREDSVSEGEARDVAGTPFDFREPRALGAGATPTTSRSVARAATTTACACGDTRPAPPRAMRCARRTPRAAASWTSS